MPITKTDVLDVARDPMLRKFRFSVGPVPVNASEYADVADYIESGGIQVVPGKGNVSLYYPQINTLRTRDANPPLDLNVRTNLLHECTHMISDIHKLNITRLNDEAAAYLAQFVYLLILNPWWPKPLTGSKDKMDIMVLVGRGIVETYHLGEPSGEGALIAQQDITNLANAIHAIPDYSSIDPAELLAADGVSLDEQQAIMFGALQLIRQAGDEAMRRDIDELMTTHVRGVSYENYVTNDNELLGIFFSYANGGASQQKTARQKLLHIFLTIDQNSAVRLSARISTLKTGDKVSERFQAVFPAGVKAPLLAVLQIQR